MSQYQCLSIRIFAPNLLLTIGWKEPCYSCGSYLFELNGTEFGLPQTELPMDR